MTESEEFELVRYLHVLWKRKFLVVSGTVLCAVAAYALSARAPVTYQTSQNLAIGRIWGQAVESIQSVTERIKSEPFLNRIVVRLPWMNEANISPRDILDGKMVETAMIESANLITIRLRAEKALHCFEMARAISEIIIADHKELFDAKLNEQLAYQKKLESKIDELEKHNARLEEMMMSFRESSSIASNTSAALLVQAQIVEKESNLMTYRRELHEVLINNNTRIQTDMTRVVDPAIVPTKPESRAITRYVMAPAILGFFVFCMLAFYLEFLEKRSIEKKQSEN